MTVEFINDWQGFKAGQTRTLDAASEAAAVGAHSARYVEIAAIGGPTTVVVQDANDGDLKSGKDTLIALTNMGTASSPIWQIEANVLPRTNTLTNLKALMTGGGELSSATDVACIVQLNGTPGSGTAAVYSPMGPGFWSDSVGARGDQQLQAKAGTGVTGQAGAGRHLLLAGGPGNITGTNKAGGSVIITGGPSTAGQGTGAQLKASSTTGDVGMAGSDGANRIFVSSANDLLSIDTDGAVPDSDPSVMGALYTTIISGVTVLAVSQG